MKSSHSITSSFQGKASSLQIFVNRNLLKTCKKTSDKQSRSLILYYRSHWDTFYYVDVNVLELTQISTHGRNASWKLLNSGCVSFHTAVNLQSNLWNCNKLLFTILNSNLVFWFIFIWMFQQHKSDRNENDVSDTNQQNIVFLFLWSTQASGNKRCFIGCHVKILYVHFVSFVACGRIKWMKK